MSAWVEHIANVSFTQHFLGIGGDAPANREIGVNDNVFDAVETYLQETSPVPAQGLHP